MGILFAATEDESFTITTPAQHFARSNEDHDFVTSGRGLALSQTALNATPTWTGVTEIWASVHASVVAINSSNTQPFLMLKDVANNKIFLQLEMDANAAVSMEYWDGAAYVEASGILAADATLMSTALHRWTLHAKIADSNGVFEFFYDDIRVAWFEGDTLLTGFTTCEQVILGAANSGTGTGAGTTFSELIVSTTPTWGQRVFTLIATGNGTNTAWTGDYTGIDDVAVANDGDNINSDTNGQVETFAATNPSGVTEPNHMIPRCVIVGFRGQNSGTGSANNIQHALRSGGTDYFGGSVTGISTTLSPYQNIWTTDPNGGGAWSISAVDGVEIGAKAVT